MPNHLQDDYFNPRSETSDNLLNTTQRTTDSIDLTDVATRIPSTIPDQPAEERNNDASAPSRRFSSVRQVVSDMTDRASRIRHQGSHRANRRASGAARRPLLGEIDKPVTDYPSQRGWADEDYLEQNPWFGKPEQKPVFSLGKPLPHVTRHNFRRSRRHGRNRDEENGFNEKEAAPRDDNYQGDVDAAPERMASRTSGLQSRTNSRTLRGGSRRQATSAGVAHSHRRNEAGQPVFDYIPGEAERASDDQEDTMSRASNNANRPVSQDNDEVDREPSYKIDGEPLGQPERSEVEEGERDPDELRNWWARIRAKHPEPLAEFLATFVATFMGLSSSLSVNLSSNTNMEYGSYETSCWAWGFAWMFGIYLGGGVSGAHMNPAISIMLSIFRGFPWRSCAVYVCIHFLASLAAGGLVYGCFSDSIHHLDPKLEIMSTTFFSTPQKWVSTTTAFFNQVIGGAIMTIAVFALGDDQNNPPGAGMHALVLGLLVTALKFTLGFNIGSALNPASDFGPRVITYAAGYRGPEVFQTGWWVIGPWIATFVGSILGCVVYDGCVFVGTESPINFKLSESLKDRSERYWRGVKEIKEKT